MNHPASAPSPRSLADASRLDDLVHSLFYPESPVARVEKRTPAGVDMSVIMSTRAVDQPKAPSIESDIKALLLHARRTNLLNKCLAECDAYLAGLEKGSQPVSSQSSMYDDTNGSSLPASPQNSSASSYYRDGNATPLPSSPDAAAYIDHGFAPSALALTRAGSDGGSSFFDTEWVTFNGLVDAERLEKARLGSIPIDVLVPDRPYALSSFGWRQIGDLYLDLVATVKDTALRTAFPSERDRDIIFARLAQMRMKGLEMHRIAHQVSVDREGGALEPDELEEPYTPVEMPKLRAPVAVPALHAGELEPLECLEVLAEVHQEYFRPYMKAGGSGGSLRGRSIREELETVEKFYKTCYANPRFAVVM